MIRYCSNCDKEVDFTIRSLEDLDNLVCPECGCHVDKNSRKPDVAKGTERTESAIGKAFVLLSRIIYYFYVTLSVFAVVAYYFHWDGLLFVLTGVILLFFILQRLCGLPTFVTGLFFIPVGAVLGYLLFKGTRGMCLGIALVFVTRHLVWAFVFFVLGKLFNLLPRS